MNIHFKKNWSFFIIYGICFINILLLVFTFYDAEIMSKYIIFKYIKFTLSGENNYAAWWSGILLLLTGLHAFDGYVRLKDNEPKAAIGWASLSIIFFILSLDEIGSIHERTDYLLGFGSFLSDLPFAIVLIVLLIYALFNLRTAECETKKTWPLIIGFCILGSVAFQEYLEHKINWPLELRRWRLVVEEGTELLGMTLLLKTCMSNSQGLLFNGKRSKTAPAFDFVYLLKNKILLVGVFIAPVVAYITAALPDQQRGHPADWFASMLFFLAAMTELKKFLEFNDNSSWYQWSSIILLIFASGVSVGYPTLPMNRYISLWGVYILTNDLKILILFLTILIIHIVRLLANKFSIYRFTFYFLLLIIVALLSSLKMSLFIIYLLTQYLGLSAYYSVSIQYSRHKYEILITNST